MILLILLVACYLLLSSFGMVFIKLGGQQNSFNISNRVFSIHLDFYTIIGIVMYLISFILWILVLQRFKLSYISPLVSGIAYILIIVLSVVILNEKISLYQGIGISIILLGVVFMNIK